MLVTMKEILDRANEGNYAVLSPDIMSEIDCRACLEAAEDMRSPLILAIAYPTTNDLAFTGMIARKLAEQSSVPVAVHLDHGADLGQVAEAMRGGFTSVMIDGSSLPLEENVAITRRTVEMVSPLGITVEAEIGHVGQGMEYDTAEDQLTDPDEAKYFIESTGIDACAVAIGTAHGAYSGVPHLDFDRLAAIKETVGIPLVLHGSSGTGNENIHKVCTMGINKVNVCNDVLRTVYEDLKATDFKGNDVYDLWPFVTDSMRNFISSQIEIMGSAGKAWDVARIGLPRGKVTMREE